MIVQTYGRRSARSSSDPVLPDTPESGGDSDSAAGDLVFELPRFPQDSSSQGRHASFFSSQDSSSPWTLDPFDVPDDIAGLPPSFSFPLSRGSKDPAMDRTVEARDPEDLISATTLMEAQEFGEMMEHMDEVSFALDGLRPWQPVRVRRASLLSLLSACSTSQKRRLLRVRGITARIIEATLDVSLDDSPSTTAVTALFFVLASDVQDNHFLDSPSCISFLLKLLNPSSPNTFSDKTTTFGSKICGKWQPQAVVNTSYKASDSTAKTIISKVSEILLTSKEIKSDNKNDERIERLDLSPKWIALLTMEKACLSTVSFEVQNNVNLLHLFRHIASECTTKSLCWDCKEPGHLASNCPNEGVCHTCGMTGHLARDCSNSLLPPGDLDSVTIATNGGILSKTGHLAQDCQNEPVCIICNVTGHVARQCPKSGTLGTFGGGVGTGGFGGGCCGGYQDVICGNCNQVGHMSWDCMGALMICHNCSGRGHMAYECPSGRFMDHGFRRDQAIKENKLTDDIVNPEITHTGHK